MNFSIEIAEKADKIYRRYISEKCRMDGDGKYSMESSLCKVMNMM